mmetsp:Transcript_11422/g.31543  ORF Transcript_11422/g.31543 Transcript_11422/m.31543 type:complete len:442 (+) Transcript_11422:219-1544(+)
MESTQTTRHRIPLALQAVFLASNRGREIHKPPTNGDANKVFVRNWLFQRRKPAEKMVAPTRAPKASPALSRREKRRKPRNRCNDSMVTIPEVSPKPRGTLEKKHTLETISSCSDKPLGIMRPEDCKEMVDRLQQHATEKEQPETPTVRIPGRPSTHGQSQSPQAFLDILMKARCYSNRKYPARECAYFSDPTPLQLASYDSELVKLVQARGEEQTLRSILSSGISTNPCNVHGESLVHVCCRLANDQALKVMLECGATLLVCDVMGRTPLHDACWRAKSCFETIDLILEQDPTLLLMQDTRGALPLSYVPKDQWGIWRDYLYSKRDDCFPQRHPRIDGPFQPPPLTQMDPNDQPIPDPPNPLTLELAALVASRQMSPGLAKERMRNALKDSMTVDSTSVLSVESSSRYDSDDDSESSVSSDIELETVVRAVSARDLALKGY